MAPLNRQTKWKGSTLIEVMVAMVILMVCVTVAMTTVISVSSVAYTKDLLKAEYVIESLPFSRVDTIIELNHRYTLSRKVVAKGTNDLYEVTWTLTDERKRTAWEQQKLICSPQND